MDHKNRTVTLRSPLPGEWGWIMSAHGSTYAKEYEYNGNFERVVGEIVCEFLCHERTTKCKAWIADVDGTPMGSIMCTAAGNDPHAEEAKVRVLHVDPDARGLGIGSMLVGECVEFAKGAGYKKISLFTHSHLKSARKIYDSFGFKVVKTKSGRKSSYFGPELEDVVMELNLE